MVVDNDDYGDGDYKHWLAEPWTDAEVEGYGLRSASDGGLLFCGVTQEQFAINGVMHQWPRSIVTLRWSTTIQKLGNLSDMDFKDCATAWLAEMSACCNREYEYVSDPSKANILYTAARLDRRNGVLADMQVPVGNVTPATQLVGRFDVDEDWVPDNPRQGQIDLYCTGGHETEHAEGVGHAPVNLGKPARIAPIYNPACRLLQPADIAELVRRNGARVSPVPTPAPSPAAAPMVDVIRVSVGGVTYEAKSTVPMRRVS